MDKKEFQEIIEFAILKEFGAEEFYAQASERAKYLTIKELLLELSKEERRHQEFLKNLAMEEIIQTRIKTIPDLKISDYEVNMEFDPHMSYRDIIRMAIRAEEQSFKLYNNLRESSNDEDLKKVFTYLANGEAQHKLKLEKIYEERAKES